MKLYDRLVEACADDWRAYVEHPFVEMMATGKLPEAAFRHYLVQDYLFLMHFSRAWALASAAAVTCTASSVVACGAAAAVVERPRETARNNSDGVGRYDESDMRKCCKPQKCRAS